MSQVAIVGYSCRFPEANNAEEYWNLLIKNELTIKDLPASRQKLSNNKLTYLKRGGFLKQNIDEFDAKFFNVSNREAVFMDPQQRLLLELTWEALENANVDPTSLKNQLVGVFIGLLWADYNNVLRDSTLNDTCEIHDAYLGSVLSAVAARISFFLKCSGPNLVVDAGCASSLNALHYACLSLQSFESNLCLAGGVNVILGSKVGKADSLILAPNGVCKTYDHLADGFGRGDGIGMLVLKRMEDAIKDGDNILGIVKSTAINCDGTGNNYGTPCKLGQARVMRSALDKAGLTPSQLNYLETHGTGTQIGDPIEIQSLQSVFDHKLKIGSVKTNIGHTEAAAGVAAAIKVLLMFQHNKIPAHINLNRLNPDITLKNIEIVTENCDFEGEYCGLSAFALSGHNAHVILQRPPPPPAKTGESQEESSTALTLSAKGEEALEAVRNQYIQYLQRNNLHEVAYTANTCRAHLSNRIFVTGKNSSEVVTKLQNNDFLKGCAKAEKSKTAFLFTDLNAKPSEPLKHPTYEQFAAECMQFVTETPTVQIQNFITQYCLFQVWKSFGVTPDYVLGYGTGEISAAAAAGILTVEDALSIVSQLKLVENTTVVAAKTSLATVENLIKNFEGLSVCAVNSPEEVAVAGPMDIIKTFSEFCLKNGCKTRRIPNYATYEQIYVTADCSPSKIGFVSGAKGELLGDNHFLFDDEYWNDILTTKVDFTKGVQSLVQCGCRSFVELGPHPVLLGHLMENLPPKMAQSSVWVPSLRNNEEGLITLFGSLGKLYIFGVEVDWRGFHQNTGLNKVILPNYPFQRTSHWVSFS